jgi:hypothetical protein
MSNKFCAKKIMHQFIVKYNKRNLYITLKIYFWSSANNSYQVTNKFSCHFRIVQNVWRGLQIKTILFSLEN